jgi:hypothetical protein
MCAPRLAKRRAPVVQEPRNGGYLMRSEDQRGRAMRLGRIVGLLAIVGGAISAHEPSHAQSAPDGKQPARTSSAPSTIATGCLRDVTELGGQGGGEVAWQESVSGHVLTDVRAGDHGGSASSHAGTAQAGSLLLIRGISGVELRKFRGQQVEIRGTLATAREVSRSGGSPKGNERAGAPSTPNGRIAGERDAPALGTGGSLRVPPSQAPGSGKQIPPEFQATSIRAIARTCPTGGR